MKSLLVILSLGLVLSGCYHENEPTVALYVKCGSRDKELIAQFYQQGEGFSDCQSLMPRWQGNCFDGSFDNKVKRSVSCEILPR